MNTIIDVSADAESSSSFSSITVTLSSIPPAAPISSPPNRPAPTKGMDMMHQEILDLKHLIDEDMARLEKLHDRNVSLAERVTWRFRKEAESVDLEVAKIASRLTTNISMLEGVFMNIEVLGKIHKPPSKKFVKRLQLGLPVFERSPEMPPTLSERLHLDSIAWRLKRLYDDPKFLYKWAVRLRHRAQCRKNSNFPLCSE